MKHAQIVHVSVEEGDMGNRKCLSAVNLEIVSDCVCDVRRAAGA